MFRHLSLVSVLLLACGREGSPPVIIEPQPILASLTIGGAIPLSVGQSHQLSVVARDAAGREMRGVPVTWSSSDSQVASVDGSGSVLAHEAGVVTISARSASIEGSANLEIQCAGSPPWRCEPAGMSLVSDYGFDALDAGGWSYRAQHAAARIVQDAGDAISPTNVLEFVYPAGFTSGGHAPAVVRTSWPGGRREIFWGFNWKASPGFQNHASGVNKLLYGWVNDNVTFGLSYLWSSGEDMPGWRQQMGFFAGASYFLVNQPVCANMRLQPGTWYQVEFHYRTSSSAGARDGAFRLWVNGILCASHPGIATLAGTITDTYLEPTWGGVGGPTMAGNHFFRFGHVRLSAR